MNLTVIGVPFVALGLSCCFSDKEPKRSPSSDESQICGTWRLVSESIGDIRMPADQLTGASLVFEKTGSISVKLPGMEVTGKYSLDPHSSPKRIDISGPDQPTSDKRPQGTHSTGRMIAGIYALHDNTLKIYYGTGANRPVAFPNKVPVAPVTGRLLPFAPPNARALLTLKRENPETVRKKRD
jgi:uncharacterized protein (TIGR03067 family)